MAQWEACYSLRHHDAIHAVVGPVVLGVDTHPMAPTCHGFGGLGSSCVAATPGDSGKRRGSAFGSTTLAVKAGESRDGRDRLIPLLLDLLQVMFFFFQFSWLIHQNWGIHWIYIYIFLIFAPLSLWMVDPMSPDGLVMFPCEGGRSGVLFEALLAAGHQSGSG